MSFAIGENVGPYRIVAQLGSGGMATVYKAYHAALDRYVAIKVLHPAFKEDPNFLARFQREAKIVARLEHPHIVPVYDFSEHAGQPYLVMRFVEGETLKARLQRGPLSLDEIMAMARPVCQALIYAHEQGVLHRDIKPSNVLLTAQGGVFLTDFGLAKMAVAGESTLSQDTLIGTPQYISPEQAQGRSDLDARTDIYSLGVVLYELLVGRVPYQADTPYAVVHDHIYTPLPMPRHLNPQLPEAFERMLLKALAKERDDRYARVADLLEALEKAASESAAALPGPIAPPPEPVAPPPAVPLAPVAPPPAAPEPTEAPTPARKPRRRRWIVLGAVGLLAVCCCAFVLIASRNQDRQHLQQARVLRQQGQVDEALAAYEAARQAKPQLVEAYLEPAEMLMGRGQPGDFISAAELCRQGISAAQDQAQLHACAARAWIASGDVEQAAPHLDWMIEHKTGGAAPYAGRALVLLRQDQVDEAHRDAQEAIRLEPEAPEGHFALGVVFLKMRQPERAKEQFEIVAGSPRAPDWMKVQARQFIDDLNR